MSHRAFRALLAAATACAAMLLLTSSAMAKDRNRDRIPDRWEHANHLSLKVDQAKRDQDHDGLRNRAEFRLGTDPRDDDTDNDGVEDGAEGAGTITAVAGTTLTITLFEGGTLTGTVDASTEIECGDREDGDEHGDGGGDTPAAIRDDGPGDGDPGDDEGEDACDASMLTMGAVVREAELAATAAGATFQKIELMTPPQAAAPPAG